MAGIEPALLETRPPFSTLFDIAQETLTAITADMKAHNFDFSKPIDVWGNLVIDGHTRLKAARDAQVQRVAIFQHQFPDEEAALAYAIRNQRDRRNLSSGEIVRCIEALHREKPQGGPRPFVTEPAKVSRDTFAGSQAKDAPASALMTAALVGTSAATVHRVMKVIKHGDQATKEALRGGTISINKAAVQTPTRHAPGRAAAQAQNLMFSVAQWEALSPEKRRDLLTTAPLSGKSHFNEQKTDRIEWAHWSWNPVTGCLHDCGYCYARDIAETTYPQLFVPTFLPERLHAPRRMTLPADASSNVGRKNVFVCSMADLFGKWVPQDWIDAIFAEVVRAPDWNFLFLTKFPQRLAEQDWPANAWCGTTVDTQARVTTAERAFRGVKAGVKWLSCEPLLERLTFSSLEMFDWVVIGGSSRSSQTPEFQPPWEWVEHLIGQARDAGCKVYLKPNLTSRPREYPGEPE